jgi:hypothetical protein
VISRLADGQRQAGAAAAAAAPAAAAAGATTPDVHAGLAAELAELAALEAAQRDLEARLEQQRALLQLRQQELEVKRRRLSAHSTPGISPQQDGLESIVAGPPATAQAQEAEPWDAIWPSDSPRDTMLRTVAGVLKDGRAALLSDLGQELRTRGMDAAWRVANGLCKQLYAALKNVPQLVISDINEASQRTVRLAL